jgi:CubicO group peptidase (beta-lactamase class C family)
MWAPLLVASFAAQSTPEVSLSVRQARVIASDWMSAKKLPGLSVTVIRGEETIWGYLAGHADLEQQIPVQRATRFRLGSASKVFTAGLALRLAAQGKLDLDAPIQTYVPAYPVKASAITARLLAGHLSGIPHYARGEYANTTHYAGVTPALARFLDRPLVAAPGQTYWYSSYGFNLLGAVAESACGLPFARCLKQEVSDPLKLDSLVLDDARALIPDRARPYSRGEAGALEHAPFVDPSDRYPSGGLLASSSDLARYATGLWNGWVKPEIAQTLLTPQRTTSGRATEVSLGWRIGKDADGRPYLHHGGEAMGGRAVLIAYPAQQLAVAITTNLTFAEITEKEVLRLAHLFLPVPPVRRGPAVTRKQQ